jgi:endoglucanase
LTFLALLVATPSLARPPDARMAVLARGVNITNWFRYPASTDPARLDAYFGDATIAGLRAAGFTFVRLALDPALATSPSLPRGLIRLRKAGLGVVVALFPTAWSLETSAADQTALRATWAALVPILRGIDRVNIFPEILNEPVFWQNAPAWAAQQTDLLGRIRAAWPEATIVLTGASWGGIDGLLAMTPPADPNVVFSVHFYEPTVLTTLGAFEPTLDHRALAALPFPAVPACVIPPTDARTKSVATYYCAQGWNPAMLSARIAQAGAWARKYNAAILGGEFGATVQLNAAARLAWLTATRQSLEAQKIGWALWGMEDIMGFNLPRPPPAYPVLDPAVLRALGLARN